MRHIETFLSKMRRFYSSRDVMGFAVSMTIGLATRDVITVIVGDVVVPLLKQFAYVSCLQDMHCWMGDLAKSAGVVALMQSVNKVAYAILIWFLLLLLSYVLLQYVVMNWILAKVEEEEEEGRENFTAMDTWQSSVY